MPGKDDGGAWDKFEEAETSLDEIMPLSETTPVPEAVPAPVSEASPSTATTGKYATLTGFEKAAAKEISGARDRLYGRDEVFMAYRLWLMSIGAHPDAATARTDSLRTWMNQNEDLVAEMMRLAAEDVKARR